MAAILYDLLNESPNIKIEISLANLIEAVDYAAKLSIAELERQRKELTEQHLTRKQTAEMLNINLSTLWRWNNEKYLCPVEIGGKRKYKLSEVNKILRNGDAL